MSSKQSKLSSPFMLEKVVWAHRPLTLYIKLVMKQVFSILLGEKQNHVDKSHRLMKTMTYGQKLHKKKQSPYLWVHWNTNGDGISSCDTFKVFSSRFPLKLNETSNSLTGRTEDDLWMQRSKRAKNQHTTTDTKKGFSSNSQQILCQRGGQKTESSIIKILKHQFTSNQIIVTLWPPDVKSNLSWLLG